MAGLFVFALGVHAVTTRVAVAAAGLPFAHLGVYFDGHVYLEIARSFPLPYAPEGIAYTGFAPGYPALIYSMRLLVPGALASWGSLALLATLIPAALAAVVFYLLGRELGVASLWPSLAFVVANSRWMSVASTPHAEPLATCLALACFLAHLRGRTGVAVVCLALAGLTRFPALLLGVPLAYDLLVRQRRRDAPTFALLGVPVLAFALFLAYLHTRIPGYEGIAAAHGVFWNPRLTWPFAALVANVELWLAGKVELPVLAYAWVAVYLVSLGVGLRAGERPRRFLAVWVASVVLFHVSLSGLVGAWDFQRLAMLAWPPALLILWSAWGRHLPRAAWALALAGLAVFGGSLTLQKVRAAVLIQSGHQPFLGQAIQRLDSDSPNWLSFRAIHEAP